MADDRLVLGLGAWLHDSDVPAPDARMSATRVMAGVEVTPRLGRFWPPTRFAPRVEPAPALGAFGPAGPPPRPVPRVQKPKVKARLHQTLTSVRVLAVASVVALTASVAFIGASMLPSSSPEQPVVAAAPAAVATLAPTATPEPTPTPAPEPTPIAPPAWPPSDHALDWHTEEVRLEAAAVSLAIGDKSFTAPGDLAATGESKPASATLEGGWFEDEVQQRLVVEVASDGRDWWVRRMRTLDGRKSAGWIEYEGLADRTRTPLGQSWEGDLRAKSTDAERKAYRKRGAAVLTFKDLRLSGFGPDGALAY